MRDRAFTERLQQIKAKYGYAHQQPNQMVVTQPHTHRNNTPTSHTIQSPSFYNYHQPSKPYPQDTVSKTQQLVSMTPPSRQPLKEGTGNAYIYHKHLKTPMNGVLDERYSPIKQLGGNTTLPISPRHSTSPQNGIGVSYFKKQIGDISPMKKEHPYQAKKYQAPKKMVNNQNLNLTTYSTTIQKQSNHEQKRYPILKVCEDQVRTHLRDDKVDSTFNPLQQCHYNINTIDKMQDRIASALKKYQQP